MRTATDDIDLTLTVLQAREQRIREMSETLHAMLRRFDTLVVQQAADLVRLRHALENERERRGGEQ
jgi:hypothetical protein